MNGAGHIWTPIRCGIAACILDGLTIKQTASAMGRRVFTVEYHVTKLRAALGARSRTHLAAILGAMQ
jgi:DNA-binding NarL/FixJ family response regulator